MNRLLSIFCVSAFITMMPGCVNKNESQQKTDQKKEITLNENSDRSDAPEVKIRLKRIDSILKTDFPVLRLKTTDPAAEFAQEMALRTPQMLAQYRDTSNTGNKMLSEIFSVRKAFYNEVPNNADVENIYRVEIYNYALNITTIVFAHPLQKRIISANLYRLMQPDLNEELTKLATTIAVHSDEVRNALGYKPGEEEALMAATKTALNRTKCERSMHLCAAPTFIKGEKALWAIVDLTDMRLVGVRWTHVGNSGPAETVSEKRMRLEKVMECNCRKRNRLKKGDWELNYELTSSDGIEITDVKFKNKPVLQSAKLVDFHVVYSNTDGFGYSDAVGCPEFSSAAVTAYDLAKVESIRSNGKEGFVLEQIFQSEQWPQPCNYSYLQRFEFYNDGSFRIATGSLGRGCGDDGTYRPVLRMVLASRNQTFQSYNKKWTDWNQEQWSLQNELTQYENDRYAYRVLTGADGGYLIEPGKGQFENNLGDYAYTYVTKYHPNLDEGDSDLPTIGPCCNTNHEQGPEKFIGSKPENIQNSPLVIWYVPQLKNNGKKGQEYCWAESYLDHGVYKTRTYPCISGPLFVPFQK